MHEDQESDPGNMRHVEEYIDNHTPSRHDYLGYFNKTVKNQFIKSVKPNEFECTFDKGLCNGWRIEPKGIKKDPRNGYLTGPMTGRIILLRVPARSIDFAGYSGKEQT